MTTKQITAIIIVLAILACAYAIVLQCTGQQDTAEKFIKWAGGGIGSLILLLIFFWGPR